MRVNVYSEEMTDRIEIISKEIEGQTFTGVRFYLYLPVTTGARGEPTGSLRGPFIHRPGDDDSAAVTFWGKRDLRLVLRKALEMLDHHYGPERRAANPDLLEALKALVDWQGVDHIGDCPGDDTCECPIVAQVNAAITKAEGRS